MRLVDHRLLNGKDDNVMKENRWNIVISVKSFTYMVIGSQGVCCKTFDWSAWLIFLDLKAVIFLFLGLRNSPIL